MVINPKASKMQFLKICILIISLLCKSAIADENIIITEDGNNNIELKNKTEIITEAEQLEKKKKYQKKIKEVKIEINKFIKLGQAYLKENQYQTSEENFKKAYKLAKAYELKHQLLEYHFEISNLYYVQGKEIKLLNSLQEAANLARLTNNEKKLAYCLSRLSYAFFHQKDFDVATNYLLDAIDINLNINAKKSLIENYYNLSIIYHWIGDFEKYQEYQELYQKLMKNNKKVQFLKLEKEVLEQNYEYKHLSQESLQTKFNKADITKLRILNKVTAKNLIYEVKIGTKIKLANLDFIIHSCWNSPADSIPSSRAILRILEYNTKGKKTQIFYGWLLSNLPSLSQFQHPIYDVQIISCKQKNLLK